MDKHKACSHQGHSESRLGLLAAPETRPQAASLRGARPGECSMMGGCTSRSCSAVAHSSSLGYCSGLKPPVHLTAALGRTENHGSRLFSL